MASEDPGLMCEIVLPLGGRLYADVDESRAFLAEYQHLYRRAGVLSGHVVACRPVSIAQLAVAYRDRVRA